MLAISQCQCPWTGRRGCTLTHLDQFAGRPSDQRTPLWHEVQSPESEDTKKDKQWWIKVKLRGWPHLNNVIIKEKPVAIALDYSDVVTTVGTAGGRGVKILRQHKNWNNNIISTFRNGQPHSLGRTYDQQNQHHQTEGERSNIRII